MGLNAFWAISDFTAENGATLLVPGSHRHPEPTPPPNSKVISAEMPAGSAILFDCSTYHAGGHNRSKAPRIGLNMIFIRAWLRQHENMYLAVPKEVVRTLPRTLQFLLGYRVVNAFMGTANSHSPLNSLW